jgi:hypothetical protein
MKIALSFLFPFCVLFFLRKERLSGKILFLILCTFFIFLYFCAEGFDVQYSKLIWFLFLISGFFYFITKLYLCVSFLFQKIKKKSLKFRFKKRSNKKRFSHYGTPHILTSFGLKVRSKSEVFIAEKLYEKKISFKYEEPLSAQGKTYYPDFTIEIGKKKYYWEHFGMLNDKQYARKTKIKIKWYDKNFPNALIWTQEETTLVQNISSLVEKMSAQKNKKS